MLRLYQRHRHSVLGASMTTCVFCPTNRRSIARSPVPVSPERGIFPNSRLSRRLGARHCPGHLVRYLSFNASFNFL